MRYTQKHIDIAALHMKEALATDEPGGPIVKMMQDFDLSPVEVGKALTHYIKKTNEDPEFDSVIDKWSHEDWYKQGFIQGLMFLIGLELAREQDQPFTGFVAEDN